MSLSQNKSKAESTEQAIEWAEYEKTDCLAIIGSDASLSDEKRDARKRFAVLNHQIARLRVELRR